MSPPIRDGSGDSIGAIRLGDGSEIAEVRTGAGDVLFSAGPPDSGDLHARYDATEISATDGDSVSTWTDETGNGYDLTAGTAPTFRTSIINGNPVVRFDGTDDILDVTFSNIAQPFTVYVVAKYRSVTSGNDILVDSESGNESSFGNGNNQTYSLFAGSFLDTGVNNTNESVFSVLFDGVDTNIRQNGGQIGSADGGTNDLSGLTVGARRDNSGFAPVDVGELLIYPSDKTAIQSDVEQHLSDKWGIAV
jgi:hypothetical protein